MSSKSVKYIQNNENRVMEQESIVLGYVYSVLNDQMTNLLLIIVYNVVSILIINLYNNISMIFILPRIYQLQIQVNLPISLHLQGIQIWLHSFLQFRLLLLLPAHSLTVPREL